MDAEPAVAKDQNQEPAAAKEDLVVGKEHIPQGQWGRGPRNWVQRERVNLQYQRESSATMARE